MNAIVRMILLGTILGAAQICRAAEHHEQPEPAAAHGVEATRPAHSDEQHPALPHDATWVTKLAGGILAMFILAVPVGLIVRATAPRELPVTHFDQEVGHGHGQDSAHAGH